MIRELWIEWKEERIRIEVIYSARKTMGLEVSGKAEVRMRAPRRTPDWQIRGFAEEKKRWIVEKYLLQKERARERATAPKADYEDNPELEKKYRELARAKLKERTEWFAGLMGVDYGRISIRAAKRRWGSCSSAGNLNFHWKLILMPPPVLDYVVVHELAHRKEMNHSPRFWAEVEKVLPDYRDRRRWLKENGESI